MNIHEPQWPELLEELDQQGYFRNPLRLRDNLSRCRMIRHLDIASPELRRLLKTGALTFAGHRKLKIYGLLTCGSGKRMKKENRVFFTSEREARSAGYRPCGNCMKQWR